MMKKAILLILVLISVGTILGQVQQDEQIGTESLPEISWADKTYVKLSPIPEELQFVNVEEQENWTNELFNFLLNEFVGTGLEKIISEVTTSLVGNVFSVLKAILDEIPLVGGSAYSNINFLHDGLSSSDEIISNSQYVLIYSFDNRGSMAQVATEIKLERAKTDIFGVVLSWEHVKTISLLNESEESEILETGKLSYIYALKKAFFLKTPGKYRLDGHKFSVKEDTKSPKVISENINYKVDGNVKLLVNEQLDLNSLNSSNISVVGSISGAKDIQIVYEDYYINIFPKSDFHPNEEVTVELSNGIKDLANNSLINYKTKYEIDNAKPQLSIPNKTPSIGNEETVFKFSIKYFDEDGDAPVKDGATLYVYGPQDKVIQMNLSEGVASNGTYSCSTKLIVGNYTYRIGFQNDANQSIMTDVFDGPQVHNSNNMTIIPYLICGVDETNEIKLRYEINDGGYKDVQLKVGKNSKIELPPKGKLDLSISTKDNYEFEQYKLKQDGEVVWEYGHSGTSIQFTEYAAGIFELRIYLDYTPKDYLISGIIKNEDNSHYLEPINISIEGAEEKTTMSSNGSYIFEGVKGGVPITIYATGVPEGYSLNPEIRKISNLRKDVNDINFTVSSSDNKVPIIQLTNKPEIESSISDISFSWEANDNVTISQDILYQFKLNGYDTNWTEWSNTTNVNYELRNGCYKFLLRAKDEVGNYSNIDTEYEFIVNANPKIDKIEKTANGVWSTKVSITKNGIEDIDNNIVLKRGHSLSSDETLIPVRLYRLNDGNLCGAIETIAAQLEVDTVFIRQGENFILKLPDSFSPAESIEYIIEWGKEISFGWQKKKKVPKGFANITDIPPFSSDEKEDRYLDRNLDLWRLATSKKRIETDDKYIYDSWTYVDKANEDGIIINEKEIENLQGSWESGVRYTRPKCSDAKITEIDNKLFISIREDLYERTYPSGEYLNTDKERFVVKILNKNGDILKSIYGDWKEDYYYSLSTDHINNNLWILNKYSNDTHKGLGFTIIDKDGNVVKENLEYYTKENGHSLYNEGCFKIGNNNVLVLFEDNWETPDRDDRGNICFQIRSNSGEVIRATTILNPALADENSDIQDEYQVDDVIIDNIGRVWISYEHDFGSETHEYFVVLDASGNIIHGPIKMNSDMDFYVCDKDNYIWTERGGVIHLYDSDFNEYKFNLQNITIPNQIHGDLVARVDYYEYKLFDRWSSVDFNINNESELNIDKFQLFHLPYNDDVLLKDVQVKLNNQEIVNISNIFPTFYESEFNGLASNTTSTFSFSQKSLLGGSLVLTFPLVFNSVPQLVKPFADMELFENFGDTLIPQYLSEAFIDNESLIYELTLDGESILAEIVNDQIKLTSIKNTFGENEVIVTANDGEYTVQDTFIVSVKEVNLPPNQPELIAPSNNLANLSLNPILEWKCTDPDDDSPLFYSVLLDQGDGNGLAKIDETNENSYDFSTSTITLLEGKNYSWAIIANDGKLDSEKSEIWKFTTETIDDINPEFTISTNENNPTNSEKIELIITASEEVTGLELSGLTIGNCSASNLQTSNNMDFTLDVEPINDGEVTVTIEGNVVEDLAGNGNVESNEFSIIYDGTAPKPEFSYSKNSLTNLDAIDVAIAFEEEISGFELSDIDFVNCTINDLTTSNNIRFTLEIIPSNVGLITLDLDENKLTDLAGNENLKADQWSISVTGIESLQDIGLKLYPNPIKDYLTISSTEYSTINIQVLTTNGKVVFSEEWESPFTRRINFSNFSNGLYFIRFIIDGEMVTQKVMLVK